MKKKVTVLLTGLLIFCCMALSGCGSKDTKNLEEFVKLTFTSNINNRYDTFINADMTDESKINEASALYYKDYEALVSTDYLDTLIANRIPFSYDKMAMEQNAEVTVLDISIVKESDGLYTYSADLQILQNDITTNAECSGKIGTTVSDGTEKINYFSCDNTSGYLQVFAK